MPPIFNDARLPQQNYYVGPFKSGSAFYTVLFSDVNYTDFAVYRATDPNDAWAAVAGSEINVSSDIVSLWAELVGTEIHVIAQEDIVTSNGRVSYHKYNTVTGVWDTSDEQVIVPPGAHGQFSNRAVGVSLAVRSDGDVVIVYYDESSSPIVKDLVMWGRRESGVWTTAVLGDEMIAVADEFPGVIVPGSNDRMHVLWTRFMGPPLFEFFVLGSTIKSDNSVEDITGIHATFTPHHLRGVHYTSGSAEKIRMVIRDRFNERISILKFDSADLVTLSEDTDVSDLAAEEIQDTCLANLLAVGSDLYLLYIDSAGKDLYSNRNFDDGGWSTEILQVAGNINGLSSNTYDNGGPVLAVIYKTDAGSLVYLEIMPEFHGFLKQTITLDVASLGRVSLDVSTKSFAELGVRSKGRVKLELEGLP